MWKLRHRVRKDFDNWRYALRYWWYIRFALFENHYGEKGGGNKNYDGRYFGKGWFSWRLYFKRIKWRNRRIDADNRAVSG